MVIGEIKMRFFHVRFKLKIKREDFLIVSASVVQSNAAQSLLSAVSLFPFSFFTLNAVI